MSVVAKSIGFLVTVATVPLTFHYLGEERYGLWMTISSIVVVISFSDLGLGNGLLSALAQAHGRGDRVAAQNAVSSAFLLLLAEAILIATVSFIVLPRVDWPRVFNINSPLAIREAGPAVMMFACLLAASLPLSVAQRIQDGHQEGYITSAWQSAGSLVGLAGVLLVVHLQLGLHWLVLAVAGGPVLASLANSAAQFRYVRPWIRPSLRRINTKATQALFKTGVVFLVLNLLTLIGLQTDNIVIAHILGASAVATYAVVQKLSLVSYVLQAFILSLWPAYGEAIARGDLHWVRRTLQRSLLLCLIGGGLIGLVVTLSGRWIIRVWVGPQVVPNMSLLIGFSTFIVVSGLIGTLAVVFNASDLLRKQVSILAITSVVVLVLKVVFCLKFGVAGVIWATNVGFVLFYVIPSAAVIRRRFWSSSSLTGSSTL